MVDVDIRVRSAEAADPDSLLLWDTAYSPEAVALDWMLAGTNDPQNIKGLSATRGLATAILLQLSTWRRAEPYDVLPTGSDPNGWWGDTIDLEENETRIGSRLWLIYRSPLNQDIADKARVHALEALQPLIKQDAVARFDVTTSFDSVAGWLALDVRGYSQDGQKIYDQKFSRLWQQEFQTSNEQAFFGSSL